MNVVSNSSNATRLRIATGIAPLALQCILIATAVAAPLSHCASPSDVKSGLVAVVERIFDALQKDNLAAFQAQLTPDYYIFSGGHRYTAETFLDAVKQAHAQGVQFTWSVVAPEVHFQCDRAWMTYLNRGSIAIGAQPKPAEWLESGEFEFGHGMWRARFIHSTQKSDDH